MGKSLDAELRKLNHSDINSSWKRTLVEIEKCLNNKNMW